MDEKIKNWKNDLAFIIISLIVVFAIHNGLKIVLHTDSPLVIVVSGSMEPVFYRGDVVLLKGVKPEDIKIGDVVVYKRPYTKYPIIHRVRAIEKLVLNGKEELCFVTWGDNNPAPDPYPYGGKILPCVPQEAVEAKALLVFPKIGLIPLEIRERLGLT
ncbi:signal peptidase I [Thermococcus paralvinellae]|uniref:Signal peptidase I n=1 Tax=Thermococcus paralvinellae TaxID=582419 RepID=W0I504_9EURY|nr:signal peptidase I [Thermococcus paralvinellae]AHF81149.1 signal peptidase I [Thermococcus paralvinellae]